MIPGRRAGRAVRRRDAVIGFAPPALDLIPERRSSLLLGPGVVGLALLGRRRMRS